MVFRILIKNIFLLVILILSFECLKAQKYPNVVIILADDMGYGDVQAYNSNSSIPTPNLNKFSEESVMFTDAHTPSAVCTPTRYGLLTGRYCWRTRLKRGVLKGYDSPLIEDNRATIASYLQMKGYTTGIVGEWHLGLGFQEGKSELKTQKTYDLTQPLYSSPNNNGFDYSYIIPASLDFAPYVFVRNKQVVDTDFEKIEDSEFPEFWRKGVKSKSLVFDGVLDNFLDEAKSFIKEEAQKDNPFFLYFPLPAPHIPLVPTESFKGKSGKGLYGDFVMQVDWTAGEVLKLIDSLGISDNTLVVFTSDNGSPMIRLDESIENDHVADSTTRFYNSENHMPNGVFSGRKSDVLEGGHRVPFIVRYPSAIKGERVENTSICLTDIFKTIVDITGGETLTGEAEDSYSFYPILKGEPKETDRPAIVHHSGKGMFALRKGDWKMIFGNGSGARTEPIGEPFKKPYQLYNLKKDNTESDNVIDDETKVAEEFNVILHEIMEKN